MSSKYAAFGCALKKGGTEYAGVTNIAGPELSLDTADVTSHDSTAAWEEHVGTILRSGNLTLDIVYDPADATHKYAAGGLLYDLVQRAEIALTLVFSDVGTTTWTFAKVLVIGFTPTAPVGEALTASVTIKPTGPVTLV